MIAKMTFAAVLFAAMPFLSVATAQAGDSGDRYYHSYKGHGYDRYMPRRIGRHHRRVDVTYRERGCVAVARRGGGYGRPIRATRRVGTGFRMRKACRRAMRKCIRALDRRQAHGRNPFAACVIVRRIPNYY